MIIINITYLLEVLFQHFKGVVINGNLLLLRLFIMLLLNNEHKELMYKEQC